MRRFTSPRFWSLALIALGLSTAAVEAGSVIVTDRRRSLVVSAGHEEGQYHLHQTTDDGPFNVDDALTVTHGEGEFTETLFSHGFIESVHDETGVRTTGRFLARSEPGPNGGIGIEQVGVGWSEFITFSLTTPHRWTAVEQSSPPVPWQFRFGDAHASLINTDIDDVEGPGYYIMVPRPAGSGTLMPGNYNFSVRIDFTDDVATQTPSEREIEFSYSLLLEPIDATPIPLPPAAVPGLVTLAGAALVAWRRRRGHLSG